VPMLQYGMALQGNMPQASHFCGWCAQSLCCYYCRVRAGAVAAAVSRLSCGLVSNKDIKKALVLDCVTRRSAQIFSPLADPAALLSAQIHWFSIFNSSMMVIFLTGLVAMILMRTLRADYARYTARDEDDLEVCHSPVPRSWPGPGSGPSPCPGSGQSPGPISGPAGVLTARQCARLVLSPEPYEHWRTG